MHLRALLKVYGNASQVNTVILGNTMPFIVYRKLPKCMNKGLNR